MEWREGRNGTRERLSMIEILIKLRLFFTDNDTELIEIYNVSVHSLAKVSGMLLLDKTDREI